MKDHVEYFENGKVKVIGELVDFVKHGKWIYYFEDGQKEKEEVYHKGKLHGTFRRWSSEGVLMVESEYKEGKRCGSAKEYYKNGTLKEIGKYDDSGQYWPIHFWDERGLQILKNGTGSKIEKFGISGLEVFRQFYENGHFVKEERL